MIDEKLIKLAVDGYTGRLGNEYSVGDSQEVLRKALIEANGGKNYLDIKAVRDGECNGLFAITEVLIQKVSEGRRVLHQLYRGSQQGSGRL